VILAIRIFNHNRDFKTGPRRENLNFSQFGTLDNHRFSGQINLNFKKKKKDPDDLLVSGQPHSTGGSAGSTSVEASGPVEPIYLFAFPLKITKSSDSSRIDPRLGHLRSAIERDPCDRNISCQNEN